MSYTLEEWSVHDADCACDAVCNEMFGFFCMAWSDYSQVKTYLQGVLTFHLVCSFNSS
jgi:hypothetical protein